MTARNHYEVLGVAPTAQRADIRQAYVRLVKRHHPDALGGRLPNRLHDVQQAYHCLLDHDSRARHDEEIAAEQRLHRARNRSVQRRLARFDRTHPQRPLKLDVGPPLLDGPVAVSPRRRIARTAGLLLLAGLLL